MLIKDLDVYFQFEYRGRDKKGVYFHILAENEFTNEDFEAITKAERTVECGYTNTCLERADYIRMALDLSDDPAKAHEGIIADLVNAFNSVSGIRKIIVSESYAPDEDEANSDFEEDYGEYDMDGYDWDSALGLNRLSLNYEVHAEGIEGECFTYSVYFEEEAGEAEAEKINDAINNYDFKLVDDDYIGYISVTADDGKVTIYLDLGNTVPQNEDKIIHGILLAINDIQGIKKVIVNEE